MKHALTTREELHTILGNLQKKHKNLLYRGLGELSERHYRKTGVLAPQAGEVGVGVGVFFTNNLAYALGFAKRTIIITTQELLDPNTDAIDERKEGYYAKIEEELARTLGQGNYDGWTIEIEVQKHDTICQGPGGYIFTKRTPVTKGELLLEVTLEVNHE